MIYLFLLVTFPNDPREGWVDYGLGAVFYNLAHSFANSPEVQSGIAGYHKWLELSVQL
jgi:hypothetical protein